METEAGEFKEDCPSETSAPLLWAIKPLSNQWFALLGVSQTHFWWVLDSPQGYPLSTVLFITFMEREQPRSSGFPVRLASDYILHDCMLLGGNVVLWTSWSGHLQSLRQPGLELAPPSLSPWSTPKKEWISDSKLGTNYGLK